MCGIPFLKENKIPVAQIEVRMTTRNRFSDEFQWRAVGRLEAGQYGGLQVITTISGNGHYH